MKSVKTARICCFALGTALLLAALFLVLHNKAEDRAGGEQATGILSSLKDALPEYVTTTTTLPAAEQFDLFAEYEQTTVPVMETVEINGNSYVGYVSVPALGIELPVLAEWSYPNLKIAPCRYSGNLYENDLILCAHNYNTHFGRLHDLHCDDEIIFTDANGQPHRYTVINIEQLAGTATDQLQRGSADEWDLTLFTCTLGGQSRVTVRAVRAEV